MREKFTQANVDYWFARFVELQERGVIVWKDFDAFQRALIAEHDRTRTKSPGTAHRQPLAKTTYYSFKKTGDTKQLTRVLNDVSFSALREFVSRNDPAIASRPEQLTLPALFRQLVQVEPNSHTEALNELPGTYLTYRPSISRPGWLIVGSLHITRKGDDLQTEEFTLYKENSTATPVHQSFKGFITYSRDNYLMLTNDSNSQFARISMLRAPVADKSLGRIFSLYGVYCGISQRPGRGIVTSRVHIERVERVGTNITKETVDRQVGYKHIDSKVPSEMIDHDLWNRLMTGDNSGVLDLWVSTVQRQVSHHFPSRSSPEPM